MGVYFIMTYEKWPRATILLNKLHIQSQPRSQGSLLPALRSALSLSLSRSVGRVGENPGNEVDTIVVHDALNAKNDCISYEALSSLCQQIPYNSTPKSDNAPKAGTPCIDGERCLPCHKDRHDKSKKGLKAV